MSKKIPSVNWQELRNYTEKFQWTDKQTGLQTTGYNPPKDATFIKRVPYHVRYVTFSGNLEEGNVVTIKVDRRRHQRKVQFVNSNEIRILNDYLIVSVDGTRFIVS